MGRQCQTHLKTHILVNENSKQEVIQEKNTTMELGMHKNGICQVAHKLFTY